MSAPNFEAFVPQLALALKGIVSRAPNSDTPWYAQITLPDVILSLSQVRTGSRPEDLGKVSVGLATLSWQDAQGGHNTTSAYDVRHSFGHGQGNGLPTYECKVSMSRGAEACARDIARRVLPGGREVYAKMVERRDSALAYSRSTEATAERLAQATGKPRAGRDASRLYVDNGNIYAGVQAQGDTVRFESFSVDLPTALKLLAVLKAVRT